MKLISIEYKNFMSVGNHPIKINLNKNQLTLVGGSNGSGKSSFLGAITHALYGKLLNNMKLEQAINSTNKKNMLTTCEFEVRGDLYKVVRGLKPKKFEIYKNEEKLDQYANARDQQKFLEVILGMGFKLFTQLVAINKERYIPFMEMTPADRRKVVEDVLGISIFSYMNDVTKQDYKAVERELKTIENSVGNNNIKLDGISKLIETIESNLSNNITKIENELEETHKELEIIEKEINDKESKLTTLDYKDGMSKAKKKLDEFSSIATDFERSIKEYEKEIKFFKDNDNCPTCEQPIDNNFKHNKIKINQDKVKEINLASEELIEELSKTNEEYEKYNSLLTMATSIQTELTQLNYERKNLNSIINKLKKELEVVEESDDQTKLKETEEEYIKLSSDIENSKKEMKGLIAQQELYLQLLDLLKDDGVKALIVKDYNLIINKKINEYLNSMGFYVNLTIDENFNEKFHSMNKESFSYENLSTGQKTRLNLAITLSLLEVASIKNSTVCNMLWCDELLENLDSDGVTDAVRLFREKLTDKYIFVTTQRYDEFLDKFDDSIKFKMTNSGFTEVVQ